MSEYKMNERIKKMINALSNEKDTNKDLFLKELIHNSNTAVTKLYELKKEEEFQKELKDYEGFIEIYFDSYDGSLTIVDNGLGMTKNELTNCTQTHAIHRANKYIEEEVCPSSVGLYSVFLVAKKISIISKGLGESTAYKYNCDGETFNVAPCINEETSGTVIYIKLKDEYAKKFTNKENLTQMIEKYIKDIEVPVMISYHEGFEEKVEKIN